ncbi:MAG: hypothetical protein WCO12_02540 [bacterium]
MPPQEQKRSPEQTKPEPKITKILFAKMLAVAIFFDVSLGAIQLIPVAGSIMASVFNVVPLTVFFIWYKIEGTSFSNPKKAISFFGASLIEFIPLVNALPAWSAEITYMYILDKKDVILEKAAGAAGGVAGGASVAGKVARFVPGGKNLSKNLQETSEKAKKLQNQIKTQQPPQQNPSISNEIKKSPIPLQPNNNSNQISAKTRNEIDENRWIFGNRPNQQTSSPKRVAPQNEIDVSNFFDDNNFHKAA